MIKALWGLGLMLKKYRHFREELLRSRAALALAGFLLVLQTFTILAMPLPMKLIVDHVLVKSGESDFLFERWISPHLEQTQIIYILFSILIIITIFNLIFDFLSNYQTRKAGYLVSRDLRERLLRSLFGAKFSYIDQTNKSDITNYFSHDIGNIETVVFEGLQTFLLALPTLVLIIAVMALTSPTLTAVLLVLVPLSVLVTSLLSKKVRSSARKSRDSLVHMSQDLLQTFSALKLIKILTADREISRRIDERFSQVKNTHLETDKIQSYYILSISGSQNILYACVLVLGTFSVLAGSLTLGSLLMFAGYAQAMARPTNTITRFLSRWQKTLASLERLEQVLTESQIESQMDGTLQMERSQNTTRMSLVDLRFSYSNGPEIFPGFSADFKSGEVIALFGPSGSGKSSFCQLLTRIQDPSSGKILFNSQDINSFQLESYRQEFGVVLQENTFLNDTIRANLLLGVGHRLVSDFDLMNALQSVNALEWVLSLPHGIETRIGDGGRALSGGEKQRLMLARAFVCPRRIYFFDEPTSALDPFSAKVINQSIQKLKAQGALVLVITHKYDEAVGADRILYFRRGENPRFVNQSELRRLALRSTPSQALPEEQRV